MKKAMTPLEKPSELRRRTAICGILTQPGNRQLTDDKPENDPDHAAKSFATSLSDVVRPETTPAQTRWRSRKPRPEERVQSLRWCAPAIAGRPPARPST
jgi:hypothetical protein